MPYRKTTISPAQGLLILINQCKNDSARLSELKRLYLCGADSPIAAESIEIFLSSPELENYKISYDRSVINNDPTRRYFETHLSYETILTQTKGLSDNLIGKIERENKLLCDRLPEDIRYDISHALEHSKKELTEDILMKSSMVPEDYICLLRDISSKKLFPSLGTKERDIVICIVQNTYLAILNAKYVDDLPIDIYGRGIYSDENRGRLMHQGQDSTQNPNFGLLKGYMPLPPSDIAKSDKPATYIKPSDQATFSEQAEWVEQNFNKLVHPFSNGISGTTLCQLRNIKGSMDNSALEFSASELQEYLRALISIRLYYGGGHSLNEYLGPLELEEIKSAFECIEHFDHINMNTMFLEENADAFEAALAKAIKYNNTILERSLLLEEFRKVTQETRNQLTSQSSQPRPEDDELDAEIAELPRQKSQTKLDENEIDEDISQLPGYGKH